MRRSSEAPSDHRAYSKAEYRKCSATRRRRSNTACRESTSIQGHSRGPAGRSPVFDGGSKVLVRNREKSARYSKESARAKNPNLASVELDKEAVGRRESSLFSPAFRAASASGHGKVRGNAQQKRRRDAERGRTLRATRPGAKIRNFPCVSTCGRSARVVRSNDAWSSVAALGAPRGGRWYHPQVLSVDACQRENGHPRG